MTLLKFQFFIIAFAVLSTGSSHAENLDLSTATVLRQDGVITLVSDHLVTLSGGTPADGRGVSGVISISTSRNPNNFKYKCDASG